LPYEADYYECYIESLYALCGDIEEAKFYFKMAGKLNPEFADAYFLIKDVAMKKMAILTPALSYYYQSLEDGADYLEVFLNLGVPKI
jgi:hypothetical protein